jgi:hypothetical protein
MLKPSKQNTMLRKLTQVMTVDAHVPRPKSQCQMLREKENG